jgi:hypothetical protein
MELEVSFRLFDAIKRMEFTFGVDQPICMPNALSAAECCSGSGDDGSHGQGGPDLTGEEGDFDNVATLAGVKSPSKSRWGRTCHRRYGCLLCSGLNRRGKH